ncbi:hypothetical protein UFOVP296_38 [uncultured Caudovirales phage]|uniref:Uncharacterized protein n=3 Tax=uncultured Caudovirales phage TaxID=2100421 RepID=A0A6J5PFK7_9CAUD|nr:hypothetical protein UFOVP296_38 [uncultured Caudovirales phage]CAB4169877.1 hypothetical protein UFOVP912_13 [uncultured Caudovirales phage]
MNNQQLPRFDTRGEQQALERLGGAMAMPMMDKSAALPYEALGAVGEAISQTGSIMAAYVKKKTDAESEIQVATIDNKLKMAWANEEEWQRIHPDTTTWDAHWKQMYDPLRNEVTGMKNLHPQAQRALKLRLIDYEGDKAAQLTSKAGATAFNQVGMLRAQQARDFIKQGDYDAGLQMGRTAVADGYAPPDFPSRLQDEAEAHKKSTLAAAENGDKDLIATALVDTKNRGPFNVLAGLKANNPDDPSRSLVYPNLDATTRLQMISTAESAVKKQQSDEIHGQGGIMDQIIEPVKGISDEIIQSSGEGLELPQNEIDDLKAFRAKYAEKEIAKQPFNEKTAISLFRRIEDYTPPDDSSTKGWEAILSQVMLLGTYGDKAGDLTRGVLLQKLYQKHPLGTSKQVLMDLPTQLSDLLEVELDSFSAAGSFGNPEVIIPKTEATKSGITVVPNEFTKVKNYDVARKQIQANIALRKELAVEIQKNPGLALDPFAFSAWVQEKLRVTGTGVAVDLEMLPSANASLFPTLPTESQLTNPFTPTK